jgi:DNA-binding CsgD family transcriptional regulator
MQNLTDVVSLLSTFEILDQSTEPYFIKNEKGLFCYCNDTFSKKIGINKNKILGSTVFDLFPVANARVYADADVELFSTTSRNQEYAGPIALPGSSAKSVTFKKNIIFSKEGAAVGYLGTFQLSQEKVNVANHTSNKLSPKEITVLNYIAQGFSAKKISKALAISNHTVASHIKSIYSKLNVHSKTEAVYKALIQIQC